MSSQIERSIVVHAPARIAYEVWANFEQYPDFMAGVEQVRRIEGGRLRWNVRIGGKDREFDAEIEEMTPDARIAWRSVDGVEHVGAVSLDPTGPAHCKVTVWIAYQPRCDIENLGDMLGFMGGHLQGDLDRFKVIAELTREQIDGWPGEILGADVPVAPSNYHPSNHPA